jgi:hypothetical protein
MAWKIPAKPENPERQRAGSEKNKQICAVLLQQNQHRFR